MAINLKTVVTVGRGGEDVHAIFTRKGLKEHDAKVRAEAIGEIKELMKKYVDWDSIDAFVKALRKLEENNDSI